MITLETVCAMVGGVGPAELHGWVARAWVRPRHDSGEWLFEDIDIARVRLIVTLRHEMQVEEATLPMVLALLDQLHDLRRDLTGLQAALRDVLDDAQRARLFSVWRAGRNDD